MFRDNPTTPLTTVVRAPSIFDVCRFCHKEGDLIAPCSRCIGFYAHRSCLNAQRVNADDPKFVYTCVFCRSEYKLLPSVSTYRRVKFYAYVIRDLLLVFCAIQLVVIILGEAARALDEAAAICLDECQPLGDHVRCTTCPPVKELFFPSSFSDQSIYYICGVALFFVGIGIFGVCNNVCNCVASESRNSTHFSRPSDCCCVVQGDGCTCCEPKDEKGVAIVLIVIVVVAVMCFAIIGIFYGMALAVGLFQQIVQRHFHYLKLKTIAADYPVADMVNLDEHIPYAQVVLDVKKLL